MNTEKIAQIASVMNQRLIGIELEIIVPAPEYREFLTAAQAVIDLRVERYNHTRRTWWKTQDDVSLHASSAWRVVEIVSPPLMPLELFTQTKALCEVLERFGASANKSCGFHVHHDAVKFTTKRLQYTMNLAIKSEKALDCLVPASRRGNANHMCKSNVDIANTWITEGGRVRGDRERGEERFRYYKLNLAAYIRHETIEWRQHSGTVEFEKIVLWVALTQALTVRSLLKVPQNLEYKNPMHNVLIQIKWATCDRDGALIPVSEIHADLCKRVVDRMTHFGFAEEAPRLASHVAEA